MVSPADPAPESTSSTFAGGRYESAIASAEALVEPTPPVHTQMISRDPDDAATTHVVEGNACSEANVETIAAAISR